MASVTRANRTPEQHPMMQRQGSNDRQTNFSRGHSSRSSSGSQAPSQRSSARSHGSGRLTRGNEERDSARSEGRAVSARTQHQNLPRYESQSGSLPRDNSQRTSSSTNQGTITGLTRQEIEARSSSLPGRGTAIPTDQGHGSVTDDAEQTQSLVSRTPGQITIRRSPSQIQREKDISGMCIRDTRLFSFIFIILLLLQVAHSSFLSYRHHRSQESLDLDLVPGSHMAVLCVFPVLLTLFSIPAILWLAANAWDFCHTGIWALLKHRNAFIVYHLAILLSTTVYICQHVYLMAVNFNEYLDGIGSDASCYCSEAGNFLQPITELYQCQCHVPEDPTPWQLVTTNLTLLDDTALQQSGSNYSGLVNVVPCNTSVEVHEATQVYLPQFQKLVYYLEMSILTIPIRIMCWTWTSEFIWRDMANLPRAITVSSLQKFRATILQYSLFAFTEGLDIYTLYSDLKDHGRDLAANLHLANWIMATIGIGFFVVHLIMPFAHLCFIRDDVVRVTEQNKFVKIFRSRAKVTLGLKLVTVVMNVCLVFLRMVMFRHFGGNDGIAMTMLFPLFIWKEFYVIIQKASEFCIEWWEQRSSKKRARE